MTIIYLIYGLAFLSLGIVLGLQTVASIRILPRRATALLALFGLIHGSFEWFKLIQYLESQGLPFDLKGLLAAGALALLPLSYVFLMAFGLELLVTLASWPRSAKLIPLGAVLVWLLVVLSGKPIDPASRIFLGFPAGCIAALGLWRSRPPADRGSKRSRVYLSLCAATMVAYGVFTGLITVYSPVVLVLRCACGILLITFLSVSFFAEVSHVQVAFSMQLLQERFADVITHDLRSSLSSIVLASDYLQRMATSGDKEKLSKLAKAIHSGATTMGRLIADLSQRAPSEFSALTLRKQMCDLRSIVEEVVRQFEAAAGSSRVELQLPGGPVWAEVDQVRIEQTLSNLLSNAYKYSLPGTRILVELKAEQDVATVAVTNRGAGIKEEELPHLFSRYYRTEDGKSRAAGSGLGLFIVKGIIEAHNGQVLVRSIPSETTTFIFKLPLAESKPEQEQAPPMKPRLRRA